MKKQKGFVSILAIIFGLLVIGGGAYYLNVNNITETASRNDLDNQLKDNDLKAESKDVNLEIQGTQQKKQEETSVTVKIPDKANNLVEATTTVQTLNLTLSSNLSDFVNNLKQCRETRFNRSQTADFLGNNATTNVVYEINKKDGKCVINITLNKIVLSLGDELSKMIGQPNAQFLDSNGNQLDLEEHYLKINKTYSPLIGKSGYCEVASNKEILIEFFTKEKGDLISYSDISFLVFGEDLNCKGQIFDESAKIGQSLTNFSFPE